MGGAVADINRMTTTMKRIPTAILPFICIAVLGFVNAVYGAGANLGETCLNRSGQQGVDACKGALKKAPGDLEMLLRLGDLLMGLEQYEEAIAVLKEAQLFHPDNQKVKSRLDIAKSLEAEWKWNEKQKTVILDQNARSKKKTEIKLNQIRCTRLKGESGLTACDEALKALPDDPVLHYARGKILLQKGKIEDARSAFTMALRFDPDNPEYQKKLAAMGGAASQESSQVYVVKRMALLKSLRDQGLITEAEFNQRKQRMLDVALQPDAGAKQKAAAKQTPSIDFGKYHALVIGIQNYKYLPKLQSTRRDATTVANVLAKQYNFEVKRLFDANRRQILLALGAYRRELGKQDNLLIYYAGHGWLDKEADAGYWLPVDAEKESDVDWLSLNSVTAAVRAIPAKHVMIIADSCYSGKLTRGVRVERRSTNYLASIARKRTRVVISSGGLEPVLDSGGKDGHSVFASAFLNALKGNRGVMDGTTLFTQIRRPVMLNAKQTPQYSDIREAGHEGGDFIFVRR